LFATRDYKEGDVILEERAPLIRLAPINKEHEGPFFVQFKWNDQPATGTKTGKRKSEERDNRTISFYESIQVPSNVEPNLVGKFRSMVQAAAAFACETPNDNVTAQLLDLYHPPISSPSEDEKAIVEVAKLALNNMRDMARDGSQLAQLLELQEETLLKIMLVWSCNSFEGGRIYDTTSRINHSCNPNAVVNVTASNDDAQRILAAANIATGDEITLSYLGTMLYADNSTRQSILQQDKHFTCLCVRCQAANDLATRVPCFYCHGRSTGQQLDEDVQYDDEHTVKYMVLTKAGSFTCDYCQKTLDGTVSGGEKLLKTVRSVSNKVSTFLRDNLTETSNNKPLRDDDNDNDAQEDEIIKQTLREQHLELASSFLGASHWTTNLLLLMELTALLEQHHAGLLDTTSAVDNDATVDTETIAQGIDMLERLVQFVDGLELKLHRGHLLSDVIIGIARALVSMGDIKSQKYALDWLTKLDDYVEKYENEGMQKVVDALKVAWTRK
jgi:hypothetical protein